MLVIQLYSIFGSQWCCWLLFGIVLPLMWLLTTKNQCRHLLISASSLDISPEIPARWCCHHERWWTYLELSYTFGPMYIPTWLVTFAVVVGVITHLLNLLAMVIPQKTNPHCRSKHQVIIISMLPSMLAFAPVDCPPFTELDHLPAVSSGPPAASYHICRFLGATWGYPMA